MKIETVKMEDKLIRKRVIEKYRKRTKNSSEKKNVIFMEFFFFIKLSFWIRLCELHDSIQTGLSSK